MNNLAIEKEEFVRFLKWCLPRLKLRWSGFRKVHGTVRKRVARRMRELGLPNISAYRERLEHDPTEWLELDRFCRIPISRFYRDKAVYETLALDVLPNCAEVTQRRGGGVLRVLCAGCASGEEPYTISLIWQLHLSERYTDVELQILALDIDDVMLHRAKAACYSGGSFRDLPSDLFEKGFARANGEYCLRDAFRRGVRFQKADLREGMPAGPFDLILCRNTAFTYFEDMAQVGVFEKLDACLRDGGFFLIGSHETLPPQASSYHRLQPGVPVFQKHAKARFAPKYGDDG